MKAKEVKHIFFYLYDSVINANGLESKRPIATVCTGINEGVFSRGISIFSESEPEGLLKKEGRKNALAFMLKANGSKKSRFPAINYDAIVQIGKIVNIPKTVEGDKILFPHSKKSRYNVIPIQHEIKCLAPRKETA